MESGRQQAPPAEIVSKIQIDIKKVLEIEAVRRQLVDGGFDPVGDTPSQFASFIQSETEKYGKVISRIGLEKN
ncbi:MAG: tripartite tricarboxylate transporter substrate-binding protein [Pseudolabrys sp.]